VAADGGKTQKVSGTASDGEFWVLKALFTIEVLEKDIRHVTLLEEVDKDSTTIRTSARHVANTLKQVPVDQGEAAKGAELLLLGSVLHQYIADEEGIDTDVLEVRIFSAFLKILTLIIYQACVNATTRMFASGSKKTKKSRKSDPTDADLIPESIDVLVDSIIGLLEQSTAYLRAVANLAFSLLSSAMQETTVDLILMVSFRPFSYCS
jgi:DNA polymerase phi